MNFLVWVCLGYAAIIAFLVILAALIVVYLDIVQPLFDRHRSRIKSPDQATFVEDPYPPRRYGDPLQVIGGGGAGSTLGLFDDEEDRR